MTPPWTFVAVLAMFSPMAIADAPAVRSEPFGKMPDGTPIDVYTLTSGKGLEARVMTLGATLMTVKTPDRAGKSDHVALHKDTLAEYVKGHPLFGSVVGRYANRIGGARFTIDGTEHKLQANAGKNQIHGGKPGFHELPWAAEPIPDAKRPGVKLTLTSPDGQNGFPGTVDVTVIYTVTADNELSIDYAATTDKPTHVNLTNHAYWNLDNAGADATNVAQHVIQIVSDHYLVGDDALIPTGELRPVRGTPLDFNTARPIGSKLADLPKKMYDHCYVLAHKPDERLTLAAKLTAAASGRTMEVLTTEPGVQFYTGYGKGLCLETQHYPDSPNQPKFPSTLLKPGETFRSQTVFRFGVEK